MWPTPGFWFPRPERQDRRPRFRCCGRRKSRYTAKPPAAQAPSRPEYREGPRASPRCIPGWPGRTIRVSRRLGRRPGWGRASAACPRPPAQKAVAPAADGTDRRRERGAKLRWCPARLLQPWASSRAVLAATSFFTRRRTSASESPACGERKVPAQCTMVFRTGRTLMPSASASKATRLPAPRLNRRRNSCGSVTCPLTVSCDVFIHLFLQATVLPYHKKVLLSIGWLAQGETLRRWCQC